LLKIISIFIIDNCIQGAQKTQWRPTISHNVILSSLEVNLFLLWHLETDALLATMFIVSNTWPQRSFCPRFTTVMSHYRACRIVTLSK